MQAAMCAEMVFGIYYLVWYYEILDAVRDAHANGMSSDALIANAQDVAFCAVMPVYFFMFLSYWGSAAWGVNLQSIEFTQTALIFVMFVATVISFSWRRISSFHCLSFKHRY